MPDDIQWDRPKEQQASEQERNEALALSKEFTSRGRPDLSSGVRDELYGDPNRPNLSGATKRTSDVFRHLIAARFAGHTVKEGCEMLGIGASDLNKLKRTHTDAWKEAHQEIKEAVLQNLAANVWITRSGLSDVAPHAVRCLYEIITDRKVGAGIRKDAAVQVLKLLDIDGSASLGATVSEAAYAFKDLADATRERFESDHINDTVEEESEEAEFVEC